MDEDTWVRIGRNRVRPCLFLFNCPTVAQPSPAQLQPHHDGSSNSPSAYSPALRRGAATHGIRRSRSRRRSRVAGLDQSTTRDSRKFTGFAGGRRPDTLGRRLRVVARRLRGVPAPAAAVPAAASLPALLQRRVQPRRRGALLPVHRRHVPGPDAGALPAPQPVADRGGARLAGGRRRGQQPAPPQPAHGRPRRATAHHRAVQRRARHVPGRGRQPRVQRPRGRRRRHPAGAHPRRRGARVHVRPGPASGGGHACVVLLLHTPLGSLSFARPGDERWTWIPPGERTGLRWSNSYRAVAYNDKDGLFYVVDSNDAIYALDLHGPSPVARRVLSELRHGDQPYRYLIHAPWGELLQAWRFREYHDPSMPPVEMAAEDGDDYRDPLVELRTDELQLYSVDGHGQRLLKLDGLENHALFLGYNGSLCLSVKEFPGLKSNCAYIMDDSTEFINYYKDNKREIGVWNMESQILQTISDTSPPKVPWLNWPTPIWITPSLL